MVEAVEVDSIESLIAMLLANDPAQAKLIFELPQEEPELMQAVRLALALAANRSVTSLEVLLLTIRTRTSTLLVMLEALKQNTALLFLDLCLVGAERLKDEVGLAVTELIKQSKTLQSFAFRDFLTETGDAAGVAVAEAAGQSPSLRSLTLAAGPRMSDATGLALAEALGRSSTLRSFSVVASDSDMGEATGLALAEALGRSASLESFSLVAARGMGNATGQALFEALGRGSALRSFSVKAQGSEMGNPTGLALAEALWRSSTLRSFELQATRQMGDATFEALAGAVASHTTLRSFACCADSTRISDGGGVAIAKALEQNSTLQSVTFEVSDTRVGDTTGLTLAESIRTNATMRSIEFSAEVTEMDGQIRQAVRDAIEKSVIRNTDLHAQRQALQQLAGWDESTRFASLRERVFRNKVFEFFYPLECRFLPLDFADCERAARRDEEPQPRQPTPEEVSAAKPADEPEHGGDSTGAKDEEQEQVGQAMAASIFEANEEENSALATAILLSKAEAPVAPDFDEDVTLLRITRYAKTDKMSSAILDSPELAACRALVADTGCELHPEWAGGAWLLLPFTQQQYIEAALELGPEHILVLSQDVPAVREAMKAIAAKRDMRPKFKQEVFDGGELVVASRRAEGGSSASSGPSQIESADMAGAGVELVVERSFYHFPLPRMDPRTNMSAPP